MCRRSVKARESMLAYIRRRSATLSTNILISMKVGQCGHVTIPKEIRGRSGSGPKTEVESALSLALWS